MDESPDKKALLTQLLENHRFQVSSLSHEMRAPLTLVYSTLQLIEAEHPEVLSFEHWSSLHCDIEYMNQLLLELSSFHSSEHLHIAPLHMDSFLKSIVLSFAAALTETDIEFTSYIEPDLPEIHADSIKVRQILLNLLGNARDALLSSAGAAGRTRPAMSLHASLADMSEKHTDYIYIDIADNGCGIQPEKMDAIFHPFVTYKENGTGLGLPIARRIASAHGGSLTVSSTPGEKTVFTLALPIVPKDVP